MFARSNLLEEDEEPFLVLPKGQVGPSLLVAARILSGTRKEFAEIKDSDLTGTRCPTAWLYSFISSQVDNPKSWTS